MGEEEKEVDDSWIDWGMSLLQNPVIRHAILYIILAIAAALGWKAEKADDKETATAQQESEQKQIDRLEGRLDAHMNREEWGRSPEYWGGLRTEEKKERETAVVEAMEATKKKEEGP